MQNKGLIKFFAILFALVSIYQLSFTYVAVGVQKNAKKFANGNPNKEVKYLDSISKEKVYNLGFADYTYGEVSKKQINKGLDLEGGINVILQISVKDVLKGLSNKSKNIVFNKALADASKNQVGNQTYLDAFFEAFEKDSQAAGGTTKLSSPDVFATRTLSDAGIKFNTSDNDVKKIIKQKVNESVESAFGVLNKRIDKFGVSQPNIQKIGESGRILVELPGAKDVDRIKKLLSSTAQLEFWETYKIDEVGNYLMDANKALQALEKSVVETKTVAKDTLASLISETTKDSSATAKGKNPLFDKFISQGGGPVLGIVAKKDTAKIAEYLRRNDIRLLLPADKKYAKFVWGKPDVVIDEKTKKSSETFELYALKGNRDGVAPMSGGVISDARDTFDQAGKPAVSMQMDGQGAKI